MSPITLALLAVLLDLSGTTPPTPPSAGRPRPPIGHRARLPADAVTAIRAVGRAARAHDLVRLRKWMTDDFTYSFGDEETPEAAIAAWQKEPSQLDRLVQTLDAGCVVGDASTVVCPPGAAGDDFYDLRAGFRRSSRGWRFAWFVAGD
jgi:hypothetical protein